MRYILQCSWQYILYRYIICNWVSAVPKYYGKYNSFSLLYSRLIYCFVDPKVWLPYHDGLIWTIIYLCIIIADCTLCCIGTRCIWSPSICNTIIRCRKSSIITCNQSIVWCILHKYLICIAILISITEERYRLSDTNCLWRSRKLFTLWTIIYDS